MIYRVGSSGHPISEPGSIHPVSEPGASHPRSEPSVSHSVSKPSGRLHPTSVRQPVLARTASSVSVRWTFKRVSLKCVWCTRRVLRQLVGYRSTPYASAPRQQWAPFPLPNFTRTNTHQLSAVRPYWGETENVPSGGMLYPVSFRPQLSFYNVAYPFRDRTCIPPSSELVLPGPGCRTRGGTSRTKNSELAGSGT